MKGDNRKLLFSFISQNGKVRAPHSISKEFPCDSMSKEGKVMKRYFAPLLYRAAVAHDMPRGKVYRNYIPIFRVYKKSDVFGRL